MTFTRQPIRHRCYHQNRGSTVSWTVGVCSGYVSPGLRSFLAFGIIGVWSSPAAEGVPAHLFLVAFVAAVFFATVLITFAAAVFLIVDQARNIRRIQLRAERSE